MTEIHIGGWGNTKSSVRRNRRKPDKVEVYTAGILNRNEYVGVWIRWYNNYIATGLEGSDTPFMLYKDPNPHRIDHVAVRTGWGASGSWKIEVSPVMFKGITPKALHGELHWVRMTSGSPLPTDAVVGGFEEGELLYVARASYNRSLCPGKYVPSAKHAFVTWGHAVRKRTKFEVLCGYNFLWVATCGDALPPGAFHGGAAAKTGHELLYIGRASLESNLIPGKVHLRYKTCCIPYKEREREVHAYEVLVTLEAKIRCWKLPNNYSDS